MKRLTPRFRRWLHHRRISSKANQRPALTRFLGYWSTRSRDQLIRLQARAHRRVPPKNFCFEENYEQVVQFLEEFRQPTVPLLRKLFRGGYVDFRAIERITPTAALVLASEFDRSRRISGRKLFTLDYEQWHPQVRRILNDVGFLSLLDVPGENSALADHHAINSERVLEFTSGEGSEGVAAERLRDSLRPLFRGLEDMFWLSLYDGLVEAMSNVAHHAYPRRYQYGYRVVRRWWMTGSIDLERQRMKIAFFDQGITIPVSLPRSNFYQKIKEFLSNDSDAILMEGASDGRQIEAAMEVSRSSTGKTERGLGLGQIRGLIDDAGAGRVRILSRYGDYQYEKNRAPIVKNWGHAIRGTLIEWEVFH